MKVKYGLGKGLISMVAVGIFMVCTSTLIFVHSPLQTLTKMILKFSDGSILFNVWSAPPFDVFLRIYMFNITNKEAFLAGREKMNVSELGPYIYREILTNENATFNEEEGTVTFTPHREFVFDKERSVRDPKVDVVTTTNLPLVGLHSLLSDQSQVINALFASLSRNLGAEPLINLTVDDYLWGYKDPLLQYANMFLPFWIDFEKLSILQRIIDKDNNNRVTLVIDPTRYMSPNSELLSEQERSAPFHVVRWNDATSVKDWGFDEIDPEELTKCHLVEGVYDGTLFPRDMAENVTLKMFRRGFCRPVSLTYAKSMKDANGFEAYEYVLADNMFDVSPENKCYCYKNKCVKGFQNIAPCYYHLPITICQPHYLNADPTYFDTVNGLNPDPKLHGSSIQIQPKLGVPLRGTLKIQINIVVDKIKGNSKLNVFNGLQVPLLWLEIESEEPPFIVLFMAYLICRVLPIVIEILKYFLGIGGLAMISGSALWILCKGRVTIPAGISLTSPEYSSIPIISIPSEFLDQCERKCEKRITLK